MRLSTWRRTYAATMTWLGKTLVATCQPTAYVLSKITDSQPRCAPVHACAVLCLSPLQRLGYNSLAQRGVAIARRLGLPNAHTYTGHWARVTSCVCLAHALLRMYALLRMCLCIVCLPQENMIAAGASVTQICTHHDWCNQSTLVRYQRCSAFGKVCAAHGLRGLHLHVVTTPCSAETDSGDDCGVQATYATGASPPATRM